MPNPPPMSTARGRRPRLRHNSRAARHPSRAVAFSATLVVSRWKATPVGSTASPCRSTASSSDSNSRTGVPKRLRRLSTFTPDVSKPDSRSSTRTGASACLRTRAASPSSSATPSTPTVTPARAASHRNSGFFGPVAVIRSPPKPAPSACCNSPSDATSTPASVAASRRSSALERLALWA